MTVLDEHKLQNCEKSLTTPPTFFCTLRTAQNIERPQGAMPFGTAKTGQTKQGDATTKLTSRVPTHEQDNTTQSNTDP
jgi:hypothetical protein